MFVEVTFSHPSPRACNTPRVSHSLRWPETRKKKKTNTTSVWWASRIFREEGKIHTYQSNHGKVEIRLQIKAEERGCSQDIKLKLFQRMHGSKYSCEGSRLQRYKSNKPTELNKTATKSDIKMFIKLHTMDRILAVLNSNWSLYSFWKWWIIRSYYK